jgi:hypothetical protein
MTYGRSIVVLPLFETKVPHQTKGSGQHAFLVFWNGGCKNSATSISKNDDGGTCKDFFQAILPKKGLKKGKIGQMKLGKYNSGNWLAWSRLRQKSGYFLPYEADFFRL